MKVREGDTFGQEYNIPKVIERNVTEAFRKLMPPIGEVLIKYNYAKVDGYQWKKDYTTKGELEYSYGFSFLRSLDVNIDDYSNKCKKFFKNLVEIKKLNELILKKEVEDLWSQA
jgi:hypothetical protein